MIVKGMLKERKTKLERCRYNESDPYGPNPVYVDGLQHDVDMLSQIACKIDAIKRNHHSVRDEMVLKMYGKNYEE